MDQPDPLYRLVVFDEVDADDRTAVRDLFCRVTGMHPTDATLWIARTPGVWPRPLPEDQTRALLDGLYELQVAAEARRADQFPDLSPARTIHDAACLDGGLRIKGLRGEPTHWVPWDKIELISAGRIEADDEYHGIKPPPWTSALSMGLRALTLRGPKLPERRTRAVRVPRAARRRGDRRPLRPADRLPDRREPDELRRTRRSAPPVRRGELPHLPRRPLCPSDPRHPHPPTRALLAATTPDAVAPADSEEIVFASTQALLDYSTHRLLWSWYSRDRDNRNNWTEF